MSISSRDARIVALGCALLVAAIVGVYAPVWHAGWVNLDDVGYVGGNPWVRDGLTLAGLRHVALHAWAGLWMPLSYASHMLDVSLFGTSPRGPHIVNVALHAVNAMLLLLWLVRSTGAVAPSLAVACVFAVHPLRVESVAWIAERKDVLSMCFALLTLHAWTWYAARPSPGRYALVIVGAALALAAKPMLVTLPLLLLLTDWWPLRRVGRIPVWRLLLEQAPIAALAGATALVTVATARAEGGVLGLADRPVADRLAHALAAPAWYAWKSVWPTGLAVLYPLPHWSVTAVDGAALLALIAGGVAAVTWRRAPWIAVGLAWFAIALLPVVGIVQAGLQGMADRFTYLSSIGLLVAVVWTIDATLRGRAARTAGAAAATVATVALAVAAHRQVGWWLDGVTLFTRSVSATEENWLAHEQLGNALVAIDPDTAVVEFTEAMRLEPARPRPVHGLATALERLGRRDEARARYRDALRLDPGSWTSHERLGALLLADGDAAGAAHHFAEAIWFHPDAEDAPRGLHDALLALGPGAGDADAYVARARDWSIAAAADRTRPGAADYSALLLRTLLGTRPDSVRGCLGRSNGTPAPFALYVAVDGTGALTEVGPLPPTPVARCLGEELRTARVPAPPFAPFHTQIGLQVNG